MPSYCGTHQRKFVGVQCPWCASANTAPVSQSDVTNAERATYRYRDADKWRAYMRDFMRRKRAG